MVEKSYVLVVFLVVYVLQSLIDLGIERLNVRYLMRWGGRVPASFEGLVDASKLSLITSYTVSKSRLGVFQEVISQLVLLGLILFGFMVGLDRVTGSLQLPRMLPALAFFLVPGLVLYAVELPFDAYRSFVVEERFGFNRVTLGTWVTDHLKAGLLSIVLFSLLLFSILWIIDSFPEHWWLWASLIVSIVQTILTVLYPVLIAPLFNKFAPVQDELLSKRIRKLMEENGIRVKNILQMDAGRRSRHTNAYFTGLGKTKQIVLYDTLLESHPHDEILSILAHEVGHFKNKHIVKQLLLFELSIVVGFYLTSLLVDWPPLYSAFGFETPRTYVGLFFIGIFWQKAGFFLQPFYMGLSRHFERQADHYAASLLRTPVPLITALRKMALDNLSNLNPHPLYVWFNYSHPPLVQRIALLEEARS